MSFADELRSVSAASVSSVDGLMDVVRSVLSEELVHQVGACYHFQITTDSGQTNNYYMDLSQGKTETVCERTLNQKKPVYQCHFTAYTWCSACYWYHDPRNNIRTEPWLSDGAHLGDLGSGLACNISEILSTMAYFCYPS